MYARLLLTWTGVASLVEKCHKNLTLDYFIIKHTHHAGMQEMYKLESSDVNRRIASCCVGYARCAGNVQVRVTGVIILCYHTLLGVNSFLFVPISRQYCGVFFGDEVI